MANLDKAFTPSALYEAVQKMSSYTKGDADVVELFKGLMEKLAVCGVTFLPDDTVDEVVAGMIDDGYSGPVYFAVYNRSRALGEPIVYDLILKTL